MTNLGCLIKGHKSGCIVLPADSTPIVWKSDCRTCGNPIRMTRESAPDWEDDPDNRPPDHDPGADKRKEGPNYRWRPKVMSSNRETPQINSLALGQITLSTYIISGQIRLDLRVL